MINEKQLVTEYSKACTAVELTKEDLKQYEKDRDDLEQQLINHLRGMDAKSTAKYEHLGHVTAMKPRFYASCAQGNNEELFDYLKAADRAELIKETVHPSSLSSFIKSQLEEGIHPPEFVSYYFKESVKFYKSKEA